MKQRKVLVGIAIAIFIILLLYWLLVAEDMKPGCRLWFLPWHNNSSLDSDRVRINHISLQG